MPPLPLIYSIRPARLEDAERVTALLQASYPVLLQRDYPSDLLRRALPRICVAKPELLRSGSYYVAETPQGQIVGAGGWSWLSPVSAALPANMGHIRHVVTDPDHIRQGIGSALMTRALQHAADEGVRKLECMSTLTAVPFYEAVGLMAMTEIDLTLAPGIRFPAVHMTMTLA
ncbi:GNAT family N-acetyltransferase [Donghicola tyrosinivorans]|jgi:GNAT superfamily N-acetyltransferase|uniref:Ribosomal protein S18 acetylase RimI-like enzyme n=1 Tax=Donghicola tyrosinivorans TaxID=1652492 RepID=A0A2T0X4P3_9RHOB|nr:GNAT family N-acetyltransferase [Donghicola tyrosinivorans]PRY93911.1 ribosomal protein S18 acetylase RimI-like enzyme [Donghicola tyrosinivorans]